jgi:hypothetical protein
MKIGDRVELVFTADPYTDLRPGDQGTVFRMSDTPWGEQVDMKWDSGSTLGMIPSEGDRIRVIKED